MSQELESGDLVDVLDHPEEVTATVYDPNPLTEKEAKKMLDYGEAETKGSGDSKVFIDEDGNERNIIDVEGAGGDEDEDYIIVNNGGELYIIERDRVKLIVKEEYRQTDIPSVSEPLRFNGNI